MIENRFQKFKKNDDGALTWQEFLNAEGISNCMDLMKKVTAFRDADTDKDDKVTRQEFVSYMSELIFHQKSAGNGWILIQISDGDNEEKPEEQPEGPKVTVADFFEKSDWSGLFDFIDVNGDGSLSWHEFLNVDGIKNCSDLMTKVTTFRDADIDGDDKVTKDEFIAHMSEYIFRHKSANGSMIDHLSDYIDLCRFAMSRMNFGPLLPVYLPRTDDILLRICDS